MLCVRIWLVKLVEYRLEMLVDLGLYIGWRLLPWLHRWSSCDLARRHLAMHHLTGLNLVRKYLVLRYVRHPVNFSHVGPLHSWHWMMIYHGLLMRYLLLHYRCHWLCPWWISNQRMWVHLLLNHAVGHRLHEKILWHILTSILVKGLIKRIVIGRERDLGCEIWVRVNVLMWSSIYPVRSLALQKVWCKIFVFFGFL